MRIFTALQLDIAIDKATYLTINEVSLFFQLIVCKHLDRLYLNIHRMFYFLVNHAIREDNDVRKCL